MLIRPLFLYVFTLSLSLGCLGSKPISNVVILANASSPASLDLAHFYATQRNIPTNFIVRLPLPLSERITRYDYEHKIRRPLFNHFQEQKWVTRRAEKAWYKEDVTKVTWVLENKKIRYLVCMYDVPLHVIDEDSKAARALKNRINKQGGHQRSEASVDAELVHLLHAQTSRKGYINNPYHGQYYLPEPLHYWLITSRLDAPSPSLVTNMITSALETERYGLQGRVYIDIQQLSKPGSYFAGDRWFLEAAQTLTRHGYLTHIDQSKGVYPSSFPMRDVALYLGWYAPQAQGPMVQPDFAFLPGSFAYHLHSFSAETVHNTEENWVGPLLDHGATASAGTTAEPYLDLTPHMHLFIDRLSHGYNLGEAFFLSTPVLSWQNILIGDPLYRPFRYPLDEHIKHLEADNHPLLVHAYIRKMNQWVREGRLHPALAYGREKLLQKNHPLLHEHLADLYAKNGMVEAALQEYQLALQEPLPDADAIWIASKALHILILTEQYEQASHLYSEIVTQLKDSIYLTWFKQMFPKVPEQ